MGPLIHQRARAQDTSDGAQVRLDHDCGRRNDQRRYGRYQSLESRSHQKCQEGLDSLTSLVRLREFSRGGHRSNKSIG